MTDKKMLIIASLLLIGLLCLQYYLVCKQLKTKKPEDIILERIELLENKIDSINLKKDSVKQVVDSTHIKIITNEKHYQEIINTIISQPTDSDYRYVSNYIRQFRSQNDSLNMR